MKKLIFILGVVFLIIILALNIAVTAKFDIGEHIAITFNSFLYVLGLIIGGIVFYNITKKLNEKLCPNQAQPVNKQTTKLNEKPCDQSYTVNKNTKIICNNQACSISNKTKKVLKILVWIAYLAFNIIWAIVVNPPVVADQVHVANLAQGFYRGSLEEFFPQLTYAGIPFRQYIACNLHQVTLAFLYSIFFKIIHFDIMELLRIINILANILTVFAVYKIGMQLSQKYKINKILLLTLIFTFFSIPMLATFIYGDAPSMAFGLISVYFIMKYTETNKAKYFVFTCISTALAYMFRMNSLIFVIATTIYLLLNIWQQIKQKKWKQSALNGILIAIYIISTILPSTIVKNYCINKYNIEKIDYPMINYVVMGMEEGPRANGWYNEAIGEHSLIDPAGANQEYIEMIKQRLNYFSKHIGYTFSFYTSKIASMWTENTYSAIFNNIDEKLEKLTDPLNFYQKILLIVTCFCSIIVLVQNRKNLSLELIFLLTIFVGGFTFHLLWEAKSRYIIPYIVILIPIASISIQASTQKIKEKVKLILRKKC